MLKKVFNIYGLTLSRVISTKLLNGEMTKKLNLDTICLKTTLAEEKYLKCKGALIKFQEHVQVSLNKGGLEVQLLLLLFVN